MFRRTLMAAVVSLLPAMALADDITQQSQDNAYPPVHITITKGYYNPYVEEKTTMGRMNAPIEDTPRTIEVVTQKTIQDQGARNMGDVMRNVSGTSLNTNRFGQRTDYMLRGYNIDDNNGTKLNGQYHLGWADVDMFTVDRIDVLKGPGASLYGKADPGGLVNITTKQPTITPQYEVSNTVGSYGYHSHSTSASGPIFSNSTADVGASYYVGLTKTQTDTFKDTNKERNGAFGEVQFTGHDSTLVIEGRYLRDASDWGAASLLPAIGNRPVNLPLDTNFSSKEDHFNVNDKSIGYRFNTHLNDYWDFNHSAKYQSVFRTMKYLSPAKNALNEKTGAYKMDYYWTDASKDLYSTDNNFVRKGSVMGHQNTFVVGMDYLYVLGKNHGGKSSSNQTFNIYNPSTYLTDKAWPTNFTWTDTESPVSTTGVYVQDQFHISDQWILDAGVRYDRSNQSSKTLTNGTWMQTYDVTDTAWSPNVGVTYKPIDGLAIYTNYSTSFMPQSPASDGTYYEPEKAQQYEIGFKTEMFNKRLRNNLVFYQLTKQNVQSKFADGTIQLTGEQRNRGVELDTTYQFSEEWSVLANYAYADATITEDATNKGNHFASIPKHTASFWAMYEPQDETWKGFGLGGGPRYVSERYGDNANTFTLPSYVVMDAGAFYNYNDNVRFQFNVRNLFDKEYYAGSNSRFNIAAGEPQTFIGTVNVKF